MPRTTKTGVKVVRKTKPVKDEVGVKLIGSSRKGLVVKTDDGEIDHFKKDIEIEIVKRGLIKEFVKSQLIDGTDFGTINIQGRDSKPVLFKPGMEKILSLFNMTSTLERDSQTWEMLGSKPGVVCYLCKLTRQGKIVAEGRGVCDVNIKKDLNSAVKIAEKRARMDACLSLGFSEYFTQDLEDMPQETSGPTNGDTIDGTFVAPRTKQAPPTPEGVTHDGYLAVTSKEMKKSQAGNTYAVLGGNFRFDGDEDWVPLGNIKAWKNTHHLMHMGGCYRINMEETTFNGEPSYAVLAFYSVIKPSPKEQSPEEREGNPSAQVDMQAAAEAAVADISF